LKWRRDAKKELFKERKYSGTRETVMQRQNYEKG
jgi:hypothetical protein